jgi:hypothetical protein
MSSPKKYFTCKGILRQVFKDWRPGDTVSHVCIFDPLTFWLGGVWGELSPVRDHILQEFNALYWTRFRTCKIARRP